jgi:erythromycin esterase
MRSRATTRSDDPQDVALPLRHAGDLDPLMERIGDARVVCIGEASHGTHEYYAWRAVLTRRLVEEKGFALVGVEGDWPDCYRVSCSVTGSRSAPVDPRVALASFERWPTWMWANEEVADFTRWLREHNLRRPSDRRVGFYGLDVYSLWESLRAVLDHLEAHHPEHLDAALDACRCLEPYAEDPQAYARSTRIVPTGCELEVVSVLSELLQRHAEDTDDADHPDARFAAEQNARSVVGADAYYRAMVRGGPESWNVRDTHMADTLDRLLEHY